jgi:hypothetical protein
MMDSPLHPECACRTGPGFLLAEITSLIEKVDSNSGESAGLARINAYLVRWIRNKHRRYDATRAARAKLAEVICGCPRLFLVLAPGHDRLLTRMTRARRDRRRSRRALGEPEGAIPSGHPTQTHHESAYHCKCHSTHTVPSVSRTRSCSPRSQSPASAEIAN